MSVSKFSLNIRKISLISSVALAYSTPLMASWNIDVILLKDASESTLNTLRVKCQKRLEEQNNKEGAFEKWFTRYTKLEEIKKFHNPSLEMIQEYLIEKEQFKAPLEKDVHPQQFKEVKVSKSSQPTIPSSVDEEIENLKVILQLDNTSEDVPEILERLLLLQNARERGVTHYLSDADLIQPPQQVAKDKKEPAKKKDSFQSTSDDLLSEFQRKFGPKNQVRHPAALSLFTGIRENNPPTMERNEKKEVKFDVKKPLNDERKKEENPLSKPLNPPGTTGKKEQKEARPLAPFSVDEEIIKLETALQTIDDGELPQRLERLLLLQDAQKRGVTHYLSDADLIQPPQQVAKNKKEPAKKESAFSVTQDDLLSEFQRKFGPKNQVRHPAALSLFTGIKVNNSPEMKGDEKKEAKFDVKKEEVKKPILSDEQEKKEEGLLSKTLNSQFDMDEKTALPNGWKLVDSSQNRDINKPVTLRKKALGVEVLGDNYTFYTDMPSLNNYDQTTFLFSVELRGTKPGTYIQYWDGVKSVSSALYNGNKKGDWETLRVEFTVDTKKARFHRLYAAILGPTKGLDIPSVDVRSVRLEPKPL